MKALRKVRSMALILTLMLVVSMTLPAMSVAAEAPVPLGRTSSFAVLAATAITNTGITTINGDAGGDVGQSASASPISDLGTLSFSGAAHLMDATAIGAHTDLVTAYDDAMGRALTATIDHDLSNITLTPGVYVGGEGGLLMSTDSTLTLDAQNNPDAVFILRSTSDLTLNSGATVRVINGGRYCRVFWVVPSSATIGTDAHFVGHIFAMTSIAAQTGATIQGQLLARTGAVTLDNNVITNGLCATARSLSITKTGRDVNGGSLMAGDAIEWVLTVKNIGIEPVTNAIVRDTVPPNTTYVAGSITGIGATAAAAPNLQWNVGTIAPGATVVLRFRSTVNAGLPKGTALRNQGTVISDQTPLQYSDFPATPVIGDVTLLRTGVDDRVWLGLAAMLLLAAGGFWALDRRRRLHA
jgi:uncharacterized repeat protein (TIGR01451 family)